MTTINNTPTETEIARSALAVCIAATLALAVAMGVGRFAFTPLFPLMVRDGLLGSEAGAWLAASNYVGYLIGALTAGRLHLKSVTLLSISLVGIVIATAAVSITTSMPAWISLRLLAGILSAWALVATSAWALGWLTSAGRTHLTGIVFSGVGLGIIFAGLFCLVAAQPGISASSMWWKLAALSGVITLIPLVLGQRIAEPTGHTQAQAPLGSPLSPSARSQTRGLVISYALFGFGYILPATYLPALARQLMDDPQVFGWAWPFFGLAAAISTWFAARFLRGISRLQIWAVSHLLMAIGVILPSLWSSLTAIIIAALLVGGTFMVITMVSMQEARNRVPTNATAILARMTAAFAGGQLAGPLALAALTHLFTDYSTALDHGLQLAAAGLLFSGAYLWREAVRPNPHQGTAT